MKKGTREEAGVDVGGRAVVESCHVARGVQVSGVLKRT